MMGQYVPNAALALGQNTPTPGNLGNALALLNSPVAGTPSAAAGAAQSTAAQQVPIIQVNPDGTYTVVTPAKTSPIAGFKNWHMIAMAPAAIAGFVALGLFLMKRSPFGRRNRSTY